MVTGIQFLCTLTEDCLARGLQSTSAFQITTSRDNCETDWAVVVYTCPICKVHQETRFIGNLASDGQAA